MKIYKLEPIDKTHKDWRASTTQKTIIVRAENPDKAREITKLKYWLAVGKTATGENLPRCPWKQEERVSCTILENSKYDEKGDPGVLDELPG